MNRRTVRCEVKSNVLLDINELFSTFLIFSFFLFAHKTLRFYYVNVYRTICFFCSLSSGDDDELLMEFFSSTFPSSLYFTFIRLYSLPFSCCCRAFEICLCGRRIILITTFPFDIQIMSSELVSYRYGHGAVKAAVELTQDAK